MADGETDANPHHLLVTPPVFSFHPPSSLFCSLIFIFCFFSFTPCHLFPLLTIFFWCFYVSWGDSASFYSLRNKNASWILENFLELKPECSSWKKAKKLKWSTGLASSLTFPQKQEPFFVSSWKKQSPLKKSIGGISDNYEATKTKWGSGSMWKRTALG